MTTQSAFPYESKFGFLKRCYSRGGRNPSKQMFKKAFAIQALRCHNICQPRLVLGLKVTKRYRNNIIYRHSGGRFHIYKIKAIRAGFVLARKYTLEDYKIAGFRFPWRQVGVFKAGSLSQHLYKVKKRTIHGKVVLSNGTLVTVSRNVLFDR